MSEINELEIKIIGTAVLAEQEEREQIFRRVEPEFFEDSSLGETFRTIRDAYLSNPQADGLSYFAALDLERRREIVAAMDTLISPTVASERLPDTLNAFFAAYKTREIRRRLGELSLGTPTAADVLKLADDVKNFSAERENTAQKYIDDYATPVRRIPTGFPKIDELLDGGFICGTLSTVGARPSTGKTTFAINIAARDPSLKTLFVSIEMSARMIYDRLISDKADVKYGDCIEHNVALATVRRVLGEYGNLTIVDDVSDVEDIVALIHELKPDLVAVDYIQIVTSKKPFENNRQRIDYISRSLKAAAKQTGAHIVSLSQITRAGKDRPTMSDLKESGGLEQDSDYIILLHRGYVTDKSGFAADPGATTMTVDKNKFGSTGEIEMHFDGKHQRFEEKSGDVARPNSSDDDGDLPF